MHPSVITELPHDSWVYLAGPMTGLPDFNYPAFRERKRWLSAVNPTWVIQNPAEHFNGDTTLPKEKYLHEATTALGVTDAVYLLPGWEGSAGALYECVVARAMGIPIYEERKVYSAKMDYNGYLVYEGFPFATRLALKLGENVLQDSRVQAQIRVRVAEEVDKLTKLDDRIDNYSGPNELVEEARADLRTGFADAVNTAFTGDIKSAWLGTYDGKQYSIGDPEPYNGSANKFVAAIMKAQGDVRQPRIVTTEPAPESILVEAEHIVNNDRNKQYGHPYDNYLDTGRIWGAMLREWMMEAQPGDPIPPRLAAGMMVAVKLARDTHHPKRDNAVDIAGYADVMDKITQREDELDKIAKEA